MALKKVHKIVSNWPYTGTQLELCILPKGSLESRINFARFGIGKIRNWPINNYVEVILRLKIVEWELRLVIKRFLVLFPFDLDAENS